MFIFWLDCRWWNLLSRNLEKQNDGVVGYVSVVSTSLSFSFLHPCASSRLWVISPSPTPFKFPTYWYCSPRGGGFGRGCSMQSTLTVLTSFSHFCMVEFEEAGVHIVQLISSNCMRIPNRHLPTWKIKVLPPVTLPTAPHPSVSKSRARTAFRPHGLITPAASRLVVYSVRWRMHSMATSARSNYIDLAADSIPGFSGLSASCARAYFERLPFYPYSVLHFFFSVDTSFRECPPLDLDSVFSFLQILNFYFLAAMAI